MPKLRRKNFNVSWKTQMKHFHLLIFGVSHYICSQPLDFMGIHLSCCINGGEITILHDVVHDHFERCKILCLLKVNSCLLAPCLRVFMSSNWHCDMNWWCPHVGRRCHHRDHTQVDLVSRVAFSHGVVVTQVTNGFYRDQFSRNMFYRLDVKVFGCLH